MPHRRFLPLAFFAPLLTLFASNEAFAGIHDVARVISTPVRCDNFWMNLLLISTPLLALGLIAALLYRFGTDPMPRTRRTKEARK